MKRFVSRYERIRHLRAQEEDTCRAAAAARNAERTSAEAERDRVLGRLAQAEAAAAGDMTTGLSGALMVSLAMEIERTRNLLMIAAENLRKAEDRHAEALVLHRQARAELRIVEEMIHRERVEHRREQLRIQEHQLQEQAAQAWHRHQEQP